MEMNGNHCVWNELPFDIRYSHLSALAVVVLDYQLLLMLFANILIVH